MKKLISTAQLSLILILLSASNSFSTYKEPVSLEGVKWPVARAEEVFFEPGVFFGQVKQSFFIQGAKDVPLSKLIDLSIFGHFRPGLSYNQAVLRFGPPKQTRTSENGSIAVYDLPTVRIEIEDHVYPGSFGGDYERRTVYAYPKPVDGCLETKEILTPVVDFFVPSKSTVEIHLSDADCPGSEAAFVYIKYGCVRAINWEIIDGTGISHDVCD